MIVDAAFRPESVENVDIGGTHKVGTVTASIEELTKAFGEPDTGFPKSSRHWQIRFGDGTVATIYDYYSTNSLADPGEDVEWSVGGRNEDPVEILDILGFDAEPISKMAA